jgi:hypothetical protein
MHSFTQYLSAGFRICLPVSSDSSAVQLSCMRNLRQAVRDVGAQGIVCTDAKQKHLEACTSIPTNQHFYMCQRGGGLVHSHIVRLK